MRAWVITAQIFMAIAACPAHAGQLMAGIGVFTLAEDGRDIQVGYRSEPGHWLYGYKYTRWTDVFHDPFTGRTLTRTTSAYEGPIVNYLLSPSDTGTWYLGMSVLRWSKTERALLTGETGSDSLIAPFLGGGYLRSMGESFYFNFGFFLSPGAKMVTRTSVSSEEDSGGFDIQIHLGVTF